MLARLLYISFYAPTPQQYVMISLLPLQLDQTKSTWKLCRDSTMGTLFGAIPNRLFRGGILLDLSVDSKPFEGPKNQDKQQTRAV